MEKMGGESSGKVEFDREIGCLGVSVMSRTDLCEIKINNINYSPNYRGLNIVVFDYEKNKVVDSTTYDSYIATPTFFHKNFSFDDEYFDSHFYIPPKYLNTWCKHYRIQYNSNRKLKERVVENGIILPNKVVGNKIYGGICDEHFNFISGHATHSAELHPGSRHISGSYKVPDNEIEFVDETVVYGGTMIDHPGHLIVESFADRIWWFLKNPDSQLRLAVTKIWGDGSARFIKEFVELFGLSTDRLLIVDRATKFRKVIVPDQCSIPYAVSVHPYEYTDEYKSVYRQMVRNIKPTSWKKIYFTKSATAKGNVIGEGYFIDFFEKRGFKIVNPEDYSLEEKVSFLHNADEFATLIGTNSIYAIFCRPSVKLTLLSRTNDFPQQIQAFLFEAAGIKNIYCIDVSRNFLHKDFTNGISLMGVTDEFRKYVKNVYDEDVEATPEESLKSNLYDYLSYIPEYYTQPKYFNTIKNQKMLTVLQNMSEVFLGKEFDASKLDLTTVEDGLRSQIRQLTVDLNASKKRIAELEKSDITKVLKMLDDAKIQVGICLEKMDALLEENIALRKELEKWKK